MEGMCFLDLSSSLEGWCMRCIEDLNDRPGPGSIRWNLYQWSSNSNMRGSKSCLKCVVSSCFQDFGLIRLFHILVGSHLTKG